MDNQIPKTGLAGRMRDWMKGRSRPFTARMICDGLGASCWEDRKRIHNSMPDFLRRGEIVVHIRPHPLKRKRRQPSAGSGRSPGRRYKYKHDWRRAPKGKNKARILKAMYVSAMAFAASDIERLSGAGRNHVDKIIKALVTDGNLAVVGRRTCAAGVGAEHLYNIADRGRFRVEVMG